MGNMFGSKPKAKGPTAEQLELERRQKEQSLKQESEINEREAMMKKRKAGQISLLSGSETGVSGMSDTLG